MFKKYLSKDLWLVQVLGGAALAAVICFNVIPGSIVENLGLVKPVTETQVAQVVTNSTITVSTQTELLNAIIAARGGETIMLKPGNYGNIFIENGQWNKVKVGTTTKGGMAPTLSSPVIITSADSNQRAVLESIELRDSFYWHFKNLSIRPLEGIKAVASTRGGNNAIIGCDISYGDSETWTITDWGKVRTAINLTGTNDEVGYNYLKNVSLGISVSSGHVHHNIVDGFAADGMRAYDNSIIEHNIIQNPVRIDENHTDAFQSFASTDNPSIENVALRNNTIINSTRPDPLRTDMQGIGLFDGYYDNWIIENNLVIVDHWHGISLYGSRNSIIRNNFVVDENTTEPGPVWTKFFNHKNGSLTENGRLENNYVQGTPQVSGSGVTSIGNVSVAFANYGTYFVDHANFDYTIKSGALPFAVGATIDKSKLAPEPIVGKKSNGTVTNANTTGTTNPTPATTLTLTASPTTLTTGSSATLTWSSTNATSCTASGSWSGSKVISGSESTGTLNNAGTQTYTLSCTGTGGSVSKSVVVTVSAPAIIDTDKDSIADSSDNCPTTANTDQKDTDQDGTGDMCDSTPNGSQTNIIISTGSRVITTDTVRVRGAAGLSSKKYGNQPAGVQGNVLSGPVSLDNYIWWNVNFDSGKDGWVSGSYLQGL